MINERKYKIENDQLVNRNTGIAIPEDEPLFIFRGKDKRALAALVAYGLVCIDKGHSASVRESVEMFKRFAEENPDKMTEPT